MWLQSDIKYNIKQVVYSAYLSFQLTGKKNVCRLVFECNFCEMRSE